MAAAVALTTRYSPAQVARITGIAPQQLAAWRRAGLLRSVLAEDGTLTMAGLVRIRRLDLLRKAHLSNRAIRRSVEAMQRHYGILDPLNDHMPLPQGARLVFRHAGSLLDPLTQQFGFDFDLPAPAPPEPIYGQHTAPGILAAYPSVTTAGTLAGQLPASAARRAELAQQLFADAVRLEERTGTAHEAAGLYRAVLRLAPHHAPAAINLGTIQYNTGHYAEAERCYRAAAEIDPDYALAFFNLGNVLDELQRLPEAVAAYTRAIQIVPQYADVHYNLALAYERLGERRRALRHWLQYVRLDPVGPWAAHARAQAKKVLATEKLSIVSRFGRAG